MTDARDFQVLTDPVGVYACTGCGVKLDLTGRAAFSPVRCPSCRAEMQVPARMGGFILVELLGVGGMGSAYRARDESLNRDVAIKIMRKSFGDDPKFVETFRREAQTAARLNHPNVVQIHSFGEFKGQPFIVMELVTGGSLDRMIAEGEPLDQTVVLRICMEIASALQSGYQMQLVHGDLKPENILLDEKGAAKLVDFGIAQLAGAGCDTKEVWGTPYYVAPEKVRRQRSDCRADIYSLGGTLFHALAGRPPFDGSDATAVVKERFMRPAPPLREVRADINPEIEAIVARMLQVEPSMRYPTYESLLSDMRRFLEHAGASVVATKKILLKKKGASSTGSIQVDSSAASSGGSPTKSMPAAVAKPGNRLVIKKGGVSPSFDPGMQTAEAASSSQAEEQDVPVKKVIPKKLIALIAAGVLALVGVSGGILAFLHHRQEVQRIAAIDATNQVHQAAVAAHAVAAQLMGTCLAQAQAAGSNLHLLDTAAEQLCVLANKTVTDVLGPESHDVMIPVHAAPGGVPPVDSVREETLKEPVLVQVRNMYRARYRVEDLAAEGTALVEEISGAHEAAGAATTETLRQQANDFSDRIQPLATGGKADEARRKLAGIRADMMVVSNLVAVVRRHQEKEAEIARQQAEAEKQRQLAAKREVERQDKIRGEVAEIHSKEQEISELLHKHAYADARRQLRTITTSLTEEESQAAYAVATQRVARIEDLRDFMAAHVAGYQHPSEGWRVESADKNGLVVRNRTTTNEVSWAELGDVRMVLFMRHYLMDEELARELRLRERVQLLIDSALYCRKFLPENKRAQEFADKLLDKAVSLLPDAKDDIELLMPGAGGKGEPEKAQGAAPP